MKAFWDNLELKPSRRSDKSLSTPCCDFMSLTNFDGYSFLAELGIINRGFSSFFSLSFVVAI